MWENITISCKVDTIMPLSWTHDNIIELGPMIITVSCPKKKKKIQSLSCVRLFATPWTAACQASLSFTIPSQGVLINV